MSRSPLQIMTFKTRLGWVAVLGCDRTVRHVLVGRDSAAEALAEIAQLPNCAALAGLTPGTWDRELAERFKAYARGEAVEFADVRIDLAHLTAFQRSVVEQCRAIKRGATLSYGELALRAGAPRAARAVGSVMANNRYPLIVPCHRVIAAGGRLGGFSAPQGPDLKRRLLALEQPSLEFSL